MRTALFVFALVIFVQPLFSQERGLDIYFIDVMGGGCTLIVTPAGESILVDSGNLTSDQRDARRIFQAMTDAGVYELDISITTHWHRDHFGAIGSLSRMVPIHRFYDKGLPDEFPDDPERFPELRERYIAAGGDEAITLHAGDRIPLAQNADGPALELLCIASNRAVLAATASQRDNPLCAECESRKFDASDNAASIALLLSYGEFQCFLGGDITWNIENKLVCPFDVIGEVDLFPVNHHGLPSSNNPVFVRTLNPSVTVFCNAPNKGRHPRVFDALQLAPGLQAVYQLHRNAQIEDPISDEYVANPDPERSGQYLKASVSPDGSRFTMSIGQDAYARAFPTK